MTEKKEPKKEPKRASTKKTTKKSPPKKQSGVTVSEQIKTHFPYSMFPVKVVHKDGKNLDEIKICYFQSEVYAQKYITNRRFTKKDYQMFIKDQKSEKQ